MCGTKASKNPFFSGISKMVDYINQYSKATCVQVSSIEPRLGAKNIGSFTEWWQEVVILGAHMGKDICV
jgi:hypothetical protein